MDSPLPILAAILIAVMVALVNFGRGTPDELVALTTEAARPGDQLIYPQLP